MLRETALSIAAGADRLLGIVTWPVTPATQGVVIITGGPQYRAGSHRQFTLMARELAQHGIVALRFDARGMGDSTGEPVGFERQSDDIFAAVDALRTAAPGLGRIVLWGLCDGASAALIYLDTRRDHGIGGLVIANPWVRTEAVEARARMQHYYLRRLISGDFWARLLTGRIGSGALIGFISSARSASAPAPETAVAYVERMTRAAHSFQGPILLLLSGNDQTAREFETFAATSPTWRRILARPAVRREALPEADHTFSRPGTLDKAIALTCRWVSST